MAATLMDELVEECLLRLPPEDPADLASAALVSRQWHRVVTGAVFRRRYIELHRSAPLLGYFINLDDSIRFVPMSSSFHPPHAHRHHVEAVHSSHGRILLRSTRARDREFSNLDDLCLFVWDPITDKDWELPVLVSPPWPDICHISNWEAALVCAVGDPCSHLHCHFKVVVVGITRGGAFSCFYSSEAESWSDRIFVSGGGGNFTVGSVLVENTLYFKRASNHVETTIAKYDLRTDQMCLIDLQCGVDLSTRGLLIATDDGSRLGFARASDSLLRLWVREQGRLAESRVIELRALLPDDALRDPLLAPETWVDKPQAAAFADTGAGIIFLRTCAGYFTIDLNSGRSKKVGEGLGSLQIVPYVNFCTPAPGFLEQSSRIIKGPGDSVVASTDDEPGAAVAVSRDQGPGDAAVLADVLQGNVVVSTDEGPGDVVVSNYEAPRAAMSSS